MELEERLREIRYELYNKFNQVKNSIGFLDVQRDIASELIISETHLCADAIDTDDKVIWQMHQDRLYALADALAWSVLHSHTIRQLAKYDSIRTSLVNQQDVFNNIVEKFAPHAKDSIYIFADITKCITIGDVIEVYDPESIAIHECKESQPGQASFANILRGRIGRQFSKAFWLQEYLNQGFGKLYRSDGVLKVIEDDSVNINHFGLLPSLIDECIDSEQGFSQVRAEPGLLYYAIEDGVEIEDIDVEPPWGAGKVVIAGVARLVEERTETAFHLPPMGFPIPLKYRILLNEVDVIIIGVLDIDYLAELFSKRGYRISYSEGVLKVGKEELSEVHPRFLNDILINFVSPQSIVDSIIGLFEKDTLIDRLEEEKDSIDGRPSGLEQFREFLEKNFEIELLDLTKPCILSIGGFAVRRKENKE